MREENKDIKKGENDIVIPKENDKKRNAQKLKKKMIIIIVAVLVLISLLFVASFIIDRYYDKKRAEESTPINYNFYPANYDENIFEDQEYTELIANGFILYTDSSSNLTLGITRETSIKYGDEVAFMIEYLYSIINGDADAYNACFSEAYFQNNKKLDRFTMQKIYNVSLVKVSSSESESGEYNEYLFTLEYQIMENNGTFRNDIGEGSKKQFIKISDKNGELLIDSVSTAGIK